MTLYQHPKLYSAISRVIRWVAYDPTNYLTQHSQTVFKGDKRPQNWQVKGYLRHKWDFIKDYSNKW